MNIIWDETVHSHWDKCVHEIKRYARQLRGNDLNAEFLMNSYLEMPCYYPEWRDELYKIGMEEYHGESYVD